jgi:hypothetical protein
MITSEMSVWNEAIEPRVARNSDDHDLIVVRLIAEHAGWQHTSKLLASGTAEARSLASKLRRAADDLEALAAAIDAETAAAAADAAAIETTA